MLASPIPRSNADLAQLTASITTFAESGEGSTSTLILQLSGTNAWRISRNGLDNKASSRQDQREQQKSLPFDCFAY
jgi:hypothetical protein